MSTYMDSKITKARKPYACSRKGCAINKGDEYLRYKLGLKWDEKVCLQCASSNASYYRCAALEDRLLPCAHP